MKLYSVRSIYFSYHPAIWCASYDEALAAAKERGWDAQIYYGLEGCEVLVATWESIGGTRVHNRRLAGPPCALEDFLDGTSKTETDNHSSE